MPSLVHTAKALGELGSVDADEKLLAAAMKDARATLGAVYRALCEDLRTPEAVRQRIVQILTRLGWVGAEYPYAPGKVTGRKAVALLCGPEQAARTKTKDGKGFPCVKKDLAGRRGKGGGAARTRHPCRGLEARAPSVEPREGDGYRQTEERITAKRRNG